MRPTRKDPRAAGDAHHGHTQVRDCSLRLLPAAHDHEPSDGGPDRVRSPGAGDARAPIRVVLAVEQALTRAGYRALLETDDQIAVIAEAASVTQAITATGDGDADIVLLDLGLPELNDFEAPAQAVSHPTFATVAVMLIASREDDERVHNAVRAGALGVVAKDVTPDELIRAVNALARGDALLSAEAVRRLVSELPPRWLRERPLSQALDELTDREREVVALVAVGLTTADIAKRLVISPATAKTHVSRAMFKLGAHTRSQLVVLAYETGLVQPRTDRSFRDRALAIA